MLEDCQAGSPNRGGRERTPVEIRPFDQQVWPYSGRTGLPHLKPEAPANDGVVKIGYRLSLDEHILARNVISCGQRNHLDVRSQRSKTQRYAAAVFVKISEYRHNVRHQTDHD